MSRVGQGLEPASSRVMGAVLPFDAPADAQQCRQDASRSRAGPGIHAAAKAMLNRSGPALAWSSRSHPTMVTIRPLGTAAQLEQRRRRAIALLRAGQPYREVARWVGASVSSVVRWTQAHCRDPRKDVLAFLRRNPRLTPHRLPAYTPEVNPNEFVWTKMKNDLAHGAPEDLDQLETDLRHSFTRLHGSQPLL
jgi:Homeodomain-like domain-containing protein